MPAGSTSSPTSSRQTIIVHRIMALCVILLLCVWIFFVSQTEAQTFHTQPTAIPGISAFVPVSPQLDTSHMSQSQLIQYGLASPPKSERFPKDYQTWQRLVQAATHRIVPQLKSGNMYVGPAKRLSTAIPINRNGPTSSTTDNWSGIVINDANNPFNQSSADVWGAFTIPQTHDLPQNPCRNAPEFPHAAYWVGIDGFGGNDVLQAGASTDTLCSPLMGGITSTFRYFWIEWYPNPAIGVTNMPVSPGDVVVVEVFAQESEGLYVLTLYDETSGMSVALKMTPPSGTSLQGNSVEWIAERPTVDNALTSLTNFGTIDWTGLFASATSQSGTTTVYTPSSPPTGTTFAVTMKDGANSISTPTLYTNASGTGDGDAARMQTSLPY